MMLSFPVVNIQASPFQNNNNNNNNTTTARNLKTHEVVSTEPRI